MASPTPPEAPTGMRRQVSRQQLAVIAGAVVVLFLVFLLVIRPALTGGGGGNKAAPPAPGTTAVPTATTLPPGGPPSESFEVFATKNPFAPLVGPNTTTPAGGTTGTTGPGGTGVTGGTGGTSGTTVPAASPGAAGGAATEPRRSQRVALLNVYQSGGRTVADVRVNDTVFTKLAPGDVFDTNFKVVSLQGSCGTFLFGDERFDLCEGQEILK
jgi:hypothetical protein